jgi:hypothetical protein
MLRMALPRMRRLQSFTAVHAAVSNHFGEARALYTKDISLPNTAVARAEARQSHLEQGLVFAVKQTLIGTRLTASSSSVGITIWKFRIYGSATAMCERMIEQWRFTAEIRCLMSE